jgi:hypothetical protein
MYHDSHFPGYISKGRRQLHLGAYVLPVTFCILVSGMYAVRAPFPETCVTSSFLLHCSVC